MPSTNEIKNLEKPIPLQEKNYEAFYTLASNEMKTIPNVKGMSGMDAITLFENLKMKVKVIGVGKVKKQSIKPGEKLQKNSTIILELS